MKKIKKAFILLAFACLAVFAQGAKNTNLWLPYSEALEKSKLDGKIVLVEFYANWCVPCHEMEKTVFSDPEVLKELKGGFHFVKLDIEKKDVILCEGERLPAPTCVRNWELGGVPAFAVVDAEKGNMSQLSVGDFEKKTFLMFLNAIRNTEKKKRN